MTLLLSSVGRGPNMPPPPPAATEARTRRARHGSVSDSGKAVVPNDTSRSQSQSARSVSAAPNGSAGAADGGAVDDTDDDDSRVGRPRIVKREVRFLLMLHLAALRGVHRQTHARTRKHARTQAFKSPIAAVSKSETMQ